MFSRPIAISLSPNTTIDDVLLALKTFFTPWQWVRGDSIQKLNNWFYEYFHTDQVLFYNSGRSAEYEILKAFGIGKGDEVIVQAFTCVAVPNSILWVGAMPVFADIDDSYNLTVETIKKRVSKKTKAIIVQHTFGVPAKIDEIIAFARERNIIVIEDCAHALGGSYKGKRLGTWGDAAFFSFGRDKVISSVFGGAAIVADRKIFSKLLEQYKELEYPRRSWIAQQLFHPIAFSVILPLYNIGVGKVLLVVLQKFHLLSFPVYKEEKQGKNPGLFPQRYPNALAILAYHQARKLDRMNAVRRRIAKIYAGEKKIIDGAIYLRYPALVTSPESVIQKFKKKGILLGNWYQSPIDPKGVDMEKIGYTKGSCPMAEEKSMRVVNLPTLI
ncbi:MAG: DegT/DnrJ/EryC1/StrS family aminotransferase, partial [Patescibacteria group bacterium]|nr:DegT/DnrJ/EryC1/StrS family aminotransferase [Patescibacteria group bacterium]